MRESLLLCNLDYRKENEVKHEQAGAYPDTDTAADSVLKAQGNSLDYVLADLGYGDYNVKDTANENHCERLLPSKLEREANRVNEEGVESHTGSLRVGHVCNKAHNERTDDGGNDSREEYCASLHARLREDTGVYNDDVRHCEERRETGHNFGGNFSTVLFQMKQFFHKKSPFIKFFDKVIARRFFKFNI